MRAYEQLPDCLMRDNTTMCAPLPSRLHWMLPSGRVINNVWRWGYPRVPRRDEIGPNMPLMGVGRLIVRSRKSLQCFV